MSVASAVTESCLDIPDGEFMTRWLCCSLCRLDLGSQSDVRRDEIYPTNYSSPLVHVGRHLLVLIRMQSMISPHASTQRGRLGRIELADRAHPIGQADARRHCHPYQPRLRNFSPAQYRRGLLGMGRRCYVFYPKSGLPCHSWTGWDGLKAGTYQQSCI